jgi:formylglycine-generating enzyme
VLSASGTNNANYLFTDPINGLTSVGAFASSPGPYGTFDQGANVQNWNEAIITINANTTWRGQRGTAWDINVGGMTSADRGSYPPTDVNEQIGFRIAAVVPEPNTLALAAIGLVILAVGRRNIKIDSSIECPLN